MKCAGCQHSINGEDQQLMVTYKACTKGTCTSASNLSHLFCLTVFTDSKILANFKINSNTQVIKCASKSNSRGRKAANTAQTVAAKLCFPQH